MCACVCVSACMYVFVSLTSRLRLCGRTIGMDLICQRSLSCPVSCRRIVTSLLPTALVKPLLSPSSSYSIRETPIITQFFLQHQGNPYHHPGALSSASPGVPGNCRKECSIPGKLPGDTIIAPVGQSRNIDRACVVLYFR